MCTYMYTCTYICIYNIHIYVYICGCVYVCIYVCIIYKYAYIYTYKYIRIYTHTYTQPHILHVYVKHFSEYFTCINSFIFHNNPSENTIVYVYQCFMDKVAKAQSLSILSKFAQLESRRFEIPDQAACPWGV